MEAIRIYSPPGNDNRRLKTQEAVVSFADAGGRYPANFLLDTMACDDIAYDDRIPSTELTP
jgi:hypothetical protein